jgi:hypothetical protein
MFKKLKETLTGHKEAEVAATDETVTAAKPKDLNKTRSRGVADLTERE